jgi:hypothetical protein
MPFIDPKKLTGKVIGDWGWSLDSLVAEEQPDAAMAGMEGGAEGELPPEMAAMAGGASPEEMGTPGMAEMPSGRAIPSSVAQNAISLLRNPGEQVGMGGMSAFAQAANPINLLQTQGLPPTVRGAGQQAGQTTNPRGLNRGGKVNTNIPNNTAYSAEGNIMNRANNIQR